LQHIQLQCNQLRVESGPYMRARTTTGSPPYLLAAELRLLAPAREGQLTQGRGQTRGEGVGGGGGGGGPARPLPPTPPAQHAQGPLQHLRHGY
jgi:hypothetical protein